MSGTELVGAIIAFLTIAGSGWAVWWRIEGRVAEAKKEATLKADAAGTKADLVAAQLAEHKLHVAETYVSKQGMREFRDEMTAGLRDIKTSISGLHDRIDRIFETHPHKGGQQ